ncbi:MAG: amino acid permease [Kordiimonadaceae bacterium]|nr:amino acid permease [Kordiimonadaceae bacterium]MBT6035701.1 amino acid permease [Kordiimonadaceae bacterium]MBT6330528.1 amino acid permease [Kordiimonadaceae bacterium]MBT7582345.1 amino acid permease [Kordiimonadaceae bacterium]
MRFFSRKTVSEARSAEQNQNSLSKVLGPVSLTALGVGAVIGSGIFVVTGVVAAVYTGPAVVLSFIIAGLGCLFAGFCYAELSSMIPASGGSYSYTYVTMGRGAAWLIAWILILEYLVASAFIAVGWSGYFSSFIQSFGWNIPENLRTAPLDFADGFSLVTTGSIINLPATMLILVITAILILGVRQSAFASNMMVLIKLSIILLFIAAGAFYVNTDNWIPFVPDNSGVFGEYGWSGIMRGAGVVFISYLGFDAVTTASEEAHTPERDMPIAIIGTLAICTGLYVAVAAILTGLVSYKKLNVPDPIFVGVDAVSPALAWLAPLINIGAMVGLASATFVLIFAQPRIFHAMSRDGLMPKFFSTVHPKFSTPFWGILITGLSAAVLASLFPISVLAELVAIGTLFAFIVVCISVIILRKREPDVKRPFSVPFYPYVPVLGILTCGYMMLSLPFATWLRLIIWMAMGLIVYFAYNMRKREN